MANTNGINIENISAEVTNNIIFGNGPGYNNGLGAINVRLYSYDKTHTQVVRGNTITGNGSVGITVSTTNAAVSDNIISNNAFAGVQINSDVDGIFTNNKIVNNGGALYTDIDVAVSGTLPNISFNIFDDITGTSGVGSYNVKSNGDPILVP